MSRKKASQSERLSTVSEAKENQPKSVSPTSIKPEEPVSNLRVIREYVEALAVALALAFFFKGFAAELFVIPTGSMATTLMGRHKDVQCEFCGFSYQISASEESNDSLDTPREAAYIPSVLAGTCPQCRYTMYVGKDNPEKKTYLSFNGDRIFVNKTQFDFRNPSRWHVTVFRYPGKPQVNYIKRLVGLENEAILVRNGDLFVKKEGAENFEIQRKPFRSLLAMLRPVDDNDYVVPGLHKIGWPTRWSFEKDSWKRSEDFKSFEVDAKQDDQKVWLHFQNVVPSSEEWFHLSQGQLPNPEGAGNPQLITDFVGYNSGITYYPGYGRSSSSYLISNREIQKDGKIRKEFFCQKNPEGMGMNWVGDLALGCRLTVRSPEGNAQFRLVKGGEVFLCTIDLANGKAELSIPSVPEFKPAAVQTPIHAGGVFDLMFFNVDEELRLSVNGQEIDFGLAGRYDRFAEPTGPLARDRSPTRLDLVPAGIGIQKGSVKVEHLKVLRDTYYIACDATTADRNCDLLFSPFRGEYPLTEKSYNKILSTPEMWGSFGKTRSATFQLGKDEFLMFGDNSPKSKDSRLWTEDGIPAYVPRDFLIGEAVFVYWPHGLRIPGTRIALIPNCSKVRFID